MSARAYLLAGVFLKYCRRRRSSALLLLPCSYEELTAFVRAVKEAGVDHVVVHARKCLLNGLSTTGNRTVPPLRYDVVHRLALEFPELEIVLNGGIDSLGAANDHIRGAGEWGGYGGGVAGVMVGRAAYFDPWTFRHTDSAIFGSADPGGGERGGRGVGGGWGVIPC